MSSEKLLRDLDHIFNITLKNNKSRETFILFLKKFSEFIDMLISEFLESFYDSGKINNIPRTPVERANMFLDLVNKEDLNEVIGEYKNVRLSLVSDYDIFGEHRKSIKLIFHTAKGDIEYTIDKLKNLLQMAHKLYNIVKKEWEI